MLGIQNLKVMTFCFVLLLMLSLEYKFLVGWSTLFNFKQAGWVFLEEQPCLVVVLCWGGSFHRFLIIPVQIKYLIFELI